MNGLIKNKELIQQEVLTAHSYALLARKQIFNKRPRYWKTITPGERIEELVGVKTDLDSMPLPELSLRNFEAGYYKMATELEAMAEELMGRKFEYSTHKSWWDDVVKPNAELIEERINRALIMKL